MQRLRRAIAQSVEHAASRQEITGSILACWAGVSGVTDAETEVMVYSLCLCLAVIQTTVLERICETVLVTIGEKKPTNHYFIAMSKLFSVPFVYKVCNFYASHFMFETTLLKSTLWI